MVRRTAAPLAAAGPDVVSSLEQISVSSGARHVAAEPTSAFFSISSDTEVRTVDSLGTETYTFAALRQGCGNAPTLGVI